MVHVGINGFGRIGRLFLRAALLHYPDVSVSAVNTSGGMEMDGWATLFKYDSAYGVFPREIHVEKGKSEKEIGTLVVNETRIPFLAIREPKDIPWSDYQTRVVVESTGVFRRKEQAEQHLKEGVRKVIISAPPKDEETPHIMLKINEEQGNDVPVISNCSCTTYSAAVIVKLINDAFGIDKATLTTVHAYTSDQRLIDGSHKDVRRARSAPNNMIPTSSGAAKSIVNVIPQLKGKFEALAIRVPVITGSISDMTFVLKKETTKEEINSLLTSAANGTYKGILEVTSDQIVSSDIVGNNASAIVDLNLTNVIGGNVAKVLSWYDNEWSYALRLVELALRA